jgi:thiol-disulfide isomerase/thioredoxin
MPEIIHENINNHCSKITDLRNQFLDKYKTDKNQAINIIKEMRIIHGCAIYDNAQNIQKVMKAKTDSLTDEDFIKLSSNESLLYVIHDNIRNCEKKAHVFKETCIATNSSDTSPPLPSRQTDTSPLDKKSYTFNLPHFDEVKTKNSVNNIREQVVEGINGIKAKLNNMGELSLHNITTEAPPKTLTGGQDPYGNQNTPDFINNIASTEANKLMDNLTDRKLEFNIKKPVIINYWADWCGYSQRFKKHWDEFKGTAEKNFPGLTALDIDVGRDKERIDLAKKVGVNGYPTMVLFLDDKTYTKTAGNLTTRDVNDFVTSYMSK